MGKRLASQASSQDSASLVLSPFLFLGPRSAASSQPFLTGNSITDVLSVGANPYKKMDGVTYHRVSINDSAEASISKVVDAACDIIDGALASKKGKGRVFVHCSAGISRSPTVVAAYLMKRRGMTLKAALGRIIRVRPQISPNAGFIHQLKELDAELHGSVSLEVDELPKREKDRLALFEEEQVAVTHADNIQTPAAPRQERDRQPKVPPPYKLRSSGRNPLSSSRDLGNYRTRCTVS